MATGAADFSGLDLSSNGSSSIYDYSSDTIPIVDPAVYNIDLAGQLAGVPGGDITQGTGYSSDPFGIGMVYTNPSVQPNPTGGWMTSASDVIKAASNAFVAFSKGSPSVATPPPKAASTSILGSLFAPPAPGASAGLGPFSWGTIIVIGVGLVALVVVAKAV